MLKLIEQTISHPIFIVGLIIGIVLSIIVAAVYVICMITAPPEDDEIEKTRHARSVHKKERSQRERRAVTNAVNMVNDGCLDLPKR